MKDESESILEEVWDMLRYENKHGHTAKQKLNRLFSKILNKWHRSLYRTRPYLDESNLKARRESWTVAELDKLERGHDKTNPKGSSDLPIIVVAYKGVHCLIDGMTRTNKWVVEGSQARHEVILLEVIEG